MGLLSRGICRWRYKSSSLHESVMSCKIPHLARCSSSCKNNIFCKKLARLVQDCNFFQTRVKLLHEMKVLPLIAKLPQKHVLWESAGAIFCATTRFSRQAAQFRRSWSSGKMLAFQTRGFVFGPVCASFFTSIPKQKGPFSVLKLPPFWLCETLKIFYCPLPFLIFCNRLDVNKSQRVLFQIFWH